VLLSTNIDAVGSRGESLLVSLPRLRTCIKSSNVMVFTVLSNQPAPPRVTGWRSEPSCVRSPPSAASPARA
jgi:hypothetical protein